VINKKVFSKKIKTNYVSRPEIIFGTSNIRQRKRRKISKYFWWLSSNGEVFVYMYSNTPRYFPGLTSIDVAHVEIEWWIDVLERRPWVLWWPVGCAQYKTLLVLYKYSNSFLLLTRIEERSHKLIKIPQTHATIYNPTQIKKKNFF